MFCNCSSNWTHNNNNNNNICFCVLACVCVCVRVTLPNSNRCAVNVYGACSCRSCFFLVRYMCGFMYVFVQFADCFLLLYVLVVSSVRSEGVIYAFYRRGRDVFEQFVHRH